jgi:predicted nucleotidyltransferase
MDSIEQKLKHVAPGIFSGTPVVFAYIYGSYVKALSHPYSDLDIGIYTKDIDIDACLDLELSLALHFDEQLNHQVQSEVRTLNHLPLSVKGRILGEARLIYSINEEERVAFETRVRSAYFDFLPVIQQYRQTYRRRTILESRHGIS